MTDSSRCVCVRKVRRVRKVIMAEDVSEETLTGGLSLLVNLSRALLQKAQQDAEGKTCRTRKSSTGGLHWK